MFFQKSLKRKKTYIFLATIALLLVNFSAALAKVSYIYVMSPEANIRSGPGAEYEIIATVDLATMLEVVDKETNKNWISVKTHGGQRGWIDKDSITYLKETPSVLSKGKGIVDFKVAKEQALKWWPTVSPHAVSVCDICNSKVPKNTGYLLTTKQVLSSQVYHEMLKTSYPEYYSAVIYNFEQDRTPWLICDGCIDKYFMDIAGSIDPQELEEAMLANKALKEDIVEAIKKNYTVEYLKDKINKNQLWLCEDREKGSIYPITPLMGKEILEILEKE